MKEYNQEKTEELLLNLSLDGEVTDISKILSKKIVGVKLNGKRGKMSTSIDMKSLGLSNYDMVDDFVSGNMQNGTINFFERSVVKNFDNLINRTRQLMYKNSVTNEGLIYYMSENNYLKFKEKFEQKYLVEFEAAKEDLISKLPIYKKTFEAKLKNFTSTRGLSAKEEKLLFSRIMYKFPTELEVKGYCMLNYTTTAFPVLDECDVKGINTLIAKDIKRDKDNSAIEVFYSMIGNCLKRSFTVVSLVLECFDDINPELELRIPSKTKGLLNETITSIAEDNKTLKNDKLVEINSDISRLIREKKDKDGEKISNIDIMTQLEFLLGKIYVYSKYLEIEDMLSENIKKCYLDEYELNLLGNTK